MKKAQLMTESVKEIIIALVIIVVLAGFVYELKGAYSKKQDIEACKASVKAHSATKTLKELSGNINADIDCPTEDLLIDNRDLQKAKFEVAESMRRCWDKFWQGKLEMFSGEGIFCSVCSMIEFKDKKKNINDFTGYLMTTKMPGQQISYMDFLQNRKNPTVKEYYDNPKIYDKNDPKLKNELEASKLYSAVFVYARGETGITQIKSWLGGRAKATTGAGVIGGAAGAVVGGVAVFALASTPPGWVVAAGIGIGIVVGATVSAITTYFAGSPPEWLALTMLTEYTEQELKDIGCTYLPVKTFKKE